MDKKEAKKQSAPSVLFSDYFQISSNTVANYGAFNISLRADLPLFIDPFLLFNSKKTEYQKLHQDIIDYLRFLKEKSAGATVDLGLLRSLYCFKEVKQNWLGFTVEGNNGSALGMDFAKALNENFHKIFSDYGDEKVTKSSHLEKLCLVKDGVGKDNISDFTTNLIKGYFLTYTEGFAKAHLSKEFCADRRIPRSNFNYKTQSWSEQTYYLPIFNGDFVILTPKDMLTRENTWINRADLVKDFENIPLAISNLELRSKINNYFRDVLPKKPKKKDRDEAAIKTIFKFPELIDYYIRYKEDRGDQAVSISEQRVSYAENLYLQQFTQLSKVLAEKTPFYQKRPDSYEEAIERVKYLKQVIENNDGYRYFYDKNGKPIRREEDLKIAYRLTFFKSDFDFNTEVNNGRGSADAKVSLGSKDSTIVELKLASNSRLKSNLEKQTEVYKQANNTKKDIKVILYFSEKELKKVQKILKELGLETAENIILVDARKSNKPSASKA